MFRVFFALVLVGLSAACAPAATPLPAISAEVCHAIDGDTIQCGRQRVRILNIDTPELHGQCPAEIEKARQAQAFTAARLVAGAIEIRPDPRRPRDRYGRTLAWVLVEGRDLGEDLIAAGLARRWDGRRRPWC